MTKTTTLCPTCHGKKLIGSRPCPTCAGQGQVVERVNTSTGTVRHTKVLNEG